MVQLLEQEPAVDFTELYGEYYPRIARYLNTRLRDPELADDLAQETLLTFWLYLPRYRDQGKPFSAILFTMARNQILTNRHYTHAVKRGQGEEVASLDRIVDDEHSSLHERLGYAPHAAVDDLLDLTDAIVLLQVGQRWLLWQAAIGYSNEELAAHYGTTKHGMEVRLYRIRVTLRKLLEGVPA